jgi:hypothetical protein
LLILFDIKTIFSSSWVKKTGDKSFQHQNQRPWPEGTQTPSNAGGIIVVRKIDWSHNGPEMLTPLEADVFRGNFIATVRNIADLQAPSSLNMADAEHKVSYSA